MKELADFLNHAPCSERKSEQAEEDSWIILMDVGETRRGKTMKQNFQRFTIGLAYSTLALATQTAWGAPEDEGSDNADEGARDVHVRATAETGAARALFHRIQYGEDTHRFDYVNEGGQEILFGFSRFAADVSFGDRHVVEAIVQPLTIETRTRTDSEITIDDTTFAEDTPLDLVYGFDFYRATYRYRLLADDRNQLGLGAGLQLRNASISFDSADGDQRVIAQDFGPAPVLSAAARRESEDGHFLEVSAEGFWAPLRYLNLRDVDVEGWLYDVAVRVGAPAWRGVEVFAGARVLGGGSTGTGPDRSRWTQTRSDPRFSYNNLALFSLTLGARTP